MLMKINIDESVKIMVKLGVLAISAIVTNKIGFCLGTHFMLF